MRSLSGNTTNDKLPTVAQIIPVMPQKLSAVGHLPGGSYRHDDVKHQLFNAMILMHTVFINLTDW